MAKNSQTFPVMKNGKFFGYADAGQIADNPALSLYDERKAEAIKAEAAVEAAKAEATKKEEAVKTAEASGGADPAAVKKGPASK